MIKIIFSLLSISMLFSGCVNKRGITAKYYSDCAEYYDLQGYYHKDCDEEDMITYREMKEAGKKVIDTGVDLTNEYLLNKQKEPVMQKNVW